MVFMMICSCITPSGNDLINVLILSGRNNHEWEKTTPMLEGMLKKAGIFTTMITESPDTLDYKELKKYDVVISNWNSWPDHDFRMSKEWEDDFLKFVTRGGGVVFIHAGASSFYDWNEYHAMGIGRWGKETKHGEQTKGKVFGLDQTHPITKGINDFYIVDEIWEKADIYPGARVLASVSATDKTDGHLISEPAVFVNHRGEGRSFYTTLGHNERALLNTGLQTLLLRAIQWSSGRKVTLEIPSSLKSIIAPGKNTYRWEQSDTALALLGNSGIIWQYHFNDRYGKPYFHPVMVKNSPLTCVSPPDHPWHLGLWFSWKFINGINYWEYLTDPNTSSTSYRSEGITEITHVEISRHTDFSADIKMKLLYHTVNEPAVMQETRNILISSPDANGSFYIDFENISDPLIDEVTLDRTPIEGEPNGQSWGGYAGLSIRFNQDYTSPETITPAGDNNYRKSNWLYMGFNTLTGEKAGVSIIQNRAYTTSSTSWYVMNNPEIPFFYYSPAVLYDSKIYLKKGENLHLKYRVWILPGVIHEQELQEKSDQYI
jgi:type 1 glutamine amidotransferase